jgi:thiamine pyrophosphate-dependent acetolactate synthase large subunit-like protein
MEAIRKIVNGDRLAAVVDIPKSFQNKQVELIILPVDEKSREKTPHKSSYGILKKYANPALITSEDGAWNAAANEKYALR